MIRDQLYKPQYVLLHQLHASCTLRFLHATLARLHATLYATLLARFFGVVVRIVVCITMDDSIRKGTN
jgi:hypothetical protein